MAEIGASSIILVEVFFLILLALDFFGMISKDQYFLKGIGKFTSSDHRNPLSMFKQSPYSTH